uniref:Uncharacterized protein n=1 Tax=Astyanax mexicanus TaxID=7994 RepID=A0A3B1J5X9_ASTMX
MEKLTAFERGQIVGALSTGASVVKTAELLNVPKDVVSQVMAAYSKHGQSALVELVKKKPQHRHKKPPPTQIAVSSRAPCSLLSLSLCIYGDPD